MLFCTTTLVGRTHTRDVTHLGVLLLIDRSVFDVSRSKIYHAPDKRHSSPGRRGSFSPIRILPYGYTYRGVGGASPFWSPNKSTVRNRNRSEFQNSTALFVLRTRFINNKIHTRSVATATRRFVGESRASKSRFKFIRISRLQTGLVGP